MFTQNRAGFPYLFIGYARILIHGQCATAIHLNTQRVHLNCSLTVGTVQYYDHSVEVILDEELLPLPVMQSCALALHVECQRQG